jgi:hypothetical protein
MSIFQYLVKAWQQIYIWYLEVEISDSCPYTYCLWLCYNTDYEGTSHTPCHKWTRTDFCLLTVSAANSKYLRLCTQRSVSLSSYTLCWV